MTEEEKQNVKTQRNADAVEIPVALDALAVYLDNDNPTWKGEVVHAETASDGSLWVHLGTDSGFEATTSVFYTKFDVTLTEE